MSRTTVEELRAPAALVLVLIVAFILWPRGGDQDEDAVGPSPSARPSVVVGAPGGEVLPPSAVATPVPSATVAAPTPTPVPEIDTFSAEVLVCRSISESRCHGEIRQLRPGTDSITALVLFTDANAGDTINAILAGPAGTIPGGEYALQGGGSGYYYSTFEAANLPRGEYTVTATRNGVEVATTSFRKAGR